MVQQTQPGACFVLSWSYNSLAVSTVHSSCAVFGLQCASCLPAETRCWAVLCAACYVTGWSLIPRPDAVYTIITHMSQARVLHPIISCKILHSTESFPVGRRVQYTRIMVNGFKVWALLAKMMLTIPMMHKAKVGAAENAPRVLACPRQLHCAILLVANLTYSCYLSFLICVLSYLCLVWIQLQCVCIYCPCQFLSATCVQCPLCYAESCARLPLWLQWSRNLCAIKCAPV